MKPRPLTMRLSLSHFLIHLWLSLLVIDYQLLADEPASKVMNRKSAKEKSTSESHPSHYQPQPLRFAPLDQARELAGELIAVDHVNRCGMIRDDRSDDQNKVNWDRPHPFALLPYATVMYQGAPADLRDIPLATHLNAAFYEGPPVPLYPDAYRPALGQSVRLSRYIEYSRVGRLEDDFSRDVRLGRFWKVDDVDIGAGKLDVSLASKSEEPNGTSFQYDIGPDTRVWKDQGFTALGEIQRGMHVLFNITMATIYGPGRVTDIWIDDVSRLAAIQHQLEKHRRYQRERGLAGRIDAVDNRTGTLSIMLFGNVDAKLLEEFASFEIFRVAPASETLRIWDPINDSKVGTGAISRVTTQDDRDSGLRLKLVIGQQGLQEGHRPGLFVKLWPGDNKTILGWPVRSAPREERLMEQ